MIVEISYNCRNVVLVSVGSTAEHHSPGPAKYEKKWLPTGLCLYHSLVHVSVKLVRQSLLIYLGKPELRLLLKELYTKAAAKWEDIGIMLGIDPNALDNLKTTENCTAPSRLREMLKVWLKKINPPPSWSAIAEALEVLGDEELASHLRDTYN